MFDTSRANLPAWRELPLGPHMWFYMKVWKGVVSERQDRREGYPSTPTPIILEPLVETMSYAYFGYINRPFVDVSGVLVKWSEIADKFIVYEHNSDDGCSHTHCHLLALGIQLDKKQLYKRKDFRELGLDGKKKEFGMDVYKEGLDTLEYMSKGMFEPVFNKGFTSEEIANAKAKGYSKKVVNVNANANDNEKERYCEWEVIKKDALAFFANDNRPTLDDVRTWTMRWYWKRDGRLPFANSYKRNACSIYYLLIENLESKFPNEYSVSVAMREVIDWAY